MKGRYNTVEVTIVIYSLGYKITSLSHIFIAISCGWYLISMKQVEAGDGQ